MARNLIVNPDSAFVRVASGSISEQGGYRARFLGDPDQTYTFQFVLSFPLSPTAIPWQTHNSPSKHAGPHHLERRSGGKQLVGAALLKCGPP